MKKKFIDEPGQMKLLIVVDKLLTGFDAPPATYLYIDKQMRDHGLFQAICRVNRLDGDDKEYGYIIDYKDLFKSLEGAVQDYTSGALDGYDKEDVAGLLEDRLGKARERLEEALEAVRALCEPVEAPQGLRRPTCAISAAKESGNAEQLKDNEPKRLALYKLVAALVRAYANLANEMAEAGYTPGADRGRSRPKWTSYEKVRNEVKLAQRRCHRPEDVRAGHAAPDRHLHPRRGKREGFGLRRPVAGPAHRGARRRRGRSAAGGHPQEPGSGGRDHREQRPQADHRRAADQSEILREDVGAAGRPDRAAQAGGAGLPEVSCRRSSNLTKQAKNPAGRRSISER